MSECRGVLAAQQIKPQASVLAAARGIACVEVDLAVLRGEREPELTLFADARSRDGAAVGRGELTLAGRLHRVLRERDREIERGADDAALLGAWAAG